MLTGIIEASAPGKPLPIPQFRWTLDSLLHAENTPAGKAEFAWTGLTDDQNLELPYGLTSFNDGAVLDDLRREFNPSDTEQARLNRSKGWINTIIERGNFAENSLDEAQRKLPLGLRRNVGGLDLILAIANMRLLPTHTEVDVVLSITIPGTAEPLMLGATGVGFSFQGGFTGDLRLELLADYGVDIVGGKSKLVFFGQSGVTGSDQGTFAVINCGGVEAMSINAALVLSRDWVKPIKNGQQWGHSG